MKIFVATNVLISGIFFSGPPFRILQAWREVQVTLIVSSKILDEYSRVAENLSAQFPDIDCTGFMGLVIAHSQIVSAPCLGASVCSDLDDDRFLAWALAAKAKIIVSGDKHLLKIGSYQGIKIFTPRRFVDALLA